MCTGNLFGFLDLDPRYIQRISLLVRRRRRMYATNQPHFRTAELFLDQRTKIAARTKALIMAAGGAYPEGALGSLGLQADQHLA